MQTVEMGAQKVFHVLLNTFEVLSDAMWHITTQLLHTRYVALQPAHIALVTNITRSRLKSSVIPKSKNKNVFMKWEIRDPAEQRRIF